MVKLPKTKLGDILHCVFWDHSDADNEDKHELLFEAFGRLVEESPYFYKIATWNEPGNLMGDQNSEYYGIVKSACIKVKVLK